MKIHHQTIRISFGIITLIILSNSYLLAQDNVLKQLILKEYHDLKNISTAASAVLKFNSDPYSSSSSVRDSGIITINLSQVNRLVNIAGKKSDIPVIRMLLSHELAHQVQYKMYPMGLEILLSECQADILAGFFLFQINMRDFYQNKETLKITSIEDPRFKTEKERLENITFSLFTSIFALGDDYGYENSHPRSLQRRTALRDGNLYGSMWLFDNLAKDMTAKLETKIQHRQTVRRYKSLLNYLPEDNVITWSLRHAQKIIHTENENCRDIVVYNDWKWNTSADHPFLFYNQTIRNTGKKRLTVNFLNQLYIKKTDDPDNSMYWINTATASYSVTLPPGQSKLIKDSLRWERENNAVMPSFIPFGNANSMYSVVSTEVKKPLTKTNIAKAETIRKEMSQETALGIILSQRKSMVRFIDGVGKIYGPKSNLIYYNSKLNYPSSIETKIELHIPYNDYKYKATLYNGKSEEGFKIIEKTIQYFKNRNKIVKEIERNKEEIVWSASDTNGTAIAGISCEINKNNRVTVELDIYGF